MWRQSADGSFAEISSGGKKDREWFLERCEVEGVEFFFFFFFNEVIWPCLKANRKDVMEQ